MERAKKSFRPRGVLKSFHPRRMLTRKGVAASAIALFVETTHRQSRSTRHVIDGG